ncbi:uncharacterized protein G2W53_014557 [Senna tora]|uniref:Uncharacterized protein n=1 Tax=Senna tora TaxID=362788 RepID=A0A834WTP4_9FABA|nr:uncharacterized protein G2W53_014557 [Senna tora]
MVPVQWSGSVLCTYIRVDDGLHETRGRISINGG